MNGRIINTRRKGRRRRASGVARRVLRKKSGRCFRCGAGPEVVYSEHVEGGGATWSVWLCRACFDAEVVTGG